MKNQMASPAPGRPVVYIAMEDRACRAAIVDALHRQGWVAIEFPSGFHVIHALADLIDGRPALRPGLIVVDAFARGCAGVTIARGLRELEIGIPIVVVSRPGEPVVESDNHLIQVVAASHAASAIAEIARPLSPAFTLDLMAVPERAIA